MPRFKVDGAVGYTSDNFILEGININFDKSLAIIGANGSGKTTLIRAMMNDSTIYKKGEWFLPREIAYLDQHYSCLNPNLTPIETIADIAPHLSHAEIRKYLNDFLFRKNEEVTTLNKYLSGGEQARLCLAQITIAPPDLLILDEVTNNIDLETKMHIIDIMKNYSGTFVVISHEQDFLDEINPQQICDVSEFSLTK